MFDDYFNELDPVKRKEILDALQPEAGEEEALAQLRALFSLRYEPSRRIAYIDHFIGAVSTLRDIAYNPGGRLSERKAPIWYRTPFIPSVWIGAANLPGRSFTGSCVS